ncbi:MAG: hypothetical protein JKY80_00855 [Mariprofundaceae bacterium]|nr:hypothetical protein [Mariprofundaceae bacterium]
MALKNTTHKKMRKTLLALLSGATMKDLIEVCGSKDSAFRMLSTLEDEYGVEISNADTVYTIRSISDDNVWKIIFKGLK